MINIDRALIQGSSILKKNDIQSPRLDSEILMSKVIKKDRKYIIFNLDKKIKKSLFYNFIDLIKKRSLGKPIAYLIGKKDFWKYEFEISENVLVPRPDTELIVEKVLSLTKNRHKLNILDIGTGSGCILISILKEKKGFYGTGLDVSKKCIDLCKINSIKFKTEGRSKFIKSDIDNFSCGKYDLIISNPPYISKIDFKYLEKDITNFEPKLALIGGIDGLSAVKKVINKSSELIKKNGKLILEIGFDQKNKVIGLLKNKGFYINETLKDFANNDRCIISTKI
tara:strand:+ start:160 stop:1005 length:846 start_codon:yes stop_codon:yes gene_type:complete